MIKEYVFLGVWLVGLFSIIAVVVIGVARMVKHDSTAYDQHMIWGKNKEDNKHFPRD